MPPSVLEMAQDIVLAQIKAGQILPDTLHEALRRTHASLVALKIQEETGINVPVQNTDVARELVNWRQSISRQAITCLECGASYKRLSRRHLQHHGLNGRSYRVKYRIPRTQPLAAQETTARRREIVQQIRPWEKSPLYQKAKNREATAAKQTGR